MANYLIAMTTFAAIYALLALGLNITWGMSGMINLGLAGFFAVGAYASALLTTAGGAPILLGLVVSFLAAALAGIVLALTTLRLRGDYLAIITLGFSEVVRLVASNEIWLTKGTDGISGIPGPFRGTLHPHSFNALFCGIALVAVVAALIVGQRVRHSPYGRVLRAIRDDDVVVAVAGKRVTRFKLQAFALGAGIMGVAGALYGHYTSYIAPDLFRPLITIYIFLALTAGGTGHNVGAVVGAFLVLALLESTRFVVEVVPGLSGVQVAAFREFLIGVLLIVMMRFRPIGLVPERLPKHVEPTAGG
jgi:branched-chain amino acid transport system permease protein